MLDLAENAELFVSMDVVVLGHFSMRYTKEVSREHTHTHTHTRAHFWGLVWGVL